MQFGIVDLGENISDLFSGRHGSRVDEVGELRKIPRRRIDYGLCSMYSDALLQRFHNPSWVGDLPSPSALALEGNPVCGDVVQIGIEVSDGVISEARFRTLGCAVAIAASDALCDLITGGSLTYAEVLDFESISEALGGIAEERVNCVTPPLNALRAALEQIRLTSDIA